MFGRNSVNTSFTKRERDVADLLSRGMSEKEIADELNISPATVNNHTRNMREKFGLTKNSEIILKYIAYRNNKGFSLKRIREMGISIILIFLNVCDVSSIGKGF